MPRQINITAPDELVAKLEAVCPKGMPLSTFARGVIEKGLAGQLPALPAAPQQVTIKDWSHILEPMAALDEMTREVLRAVHEADRWNRLRHKTNAELDRMAANEGEQATRDWERSVGR